MYSAFTTDNPKRKAASSGTNITTAQRKSLTPASTIAAAALKTWVRKLERSTAIQPTPSQNNWERRETERSRDKGTEAKTRVMIMQPKFPELTTRVVSKVSPVMISVNPVVETAE
jgi:hypothetical protein